MKLKYTDTKTAFKYIKLTHLRDDKCLTS